MRPVIYTSGPYRGQTRAHVHHNILTARHWAIQLWRQGWAVICPHLNTAHFDGTCPDYVWIEGDLEILKRCDAVYMIPGWENSSGSCAEYNQALESKLIICDDLTESWFALKHLTQ